MSELSDLVKDGVEAIIEDYLKNNLSVRLYHEYVGSNELRVKVKIGIGGGEIISDWTDISLDLL